MEERKRKFDFSRMDGMTVSEFADSLTDGEREYLVNEVKESMSPEKFDSLTEAGLKKEIAFQALLDEACADLEIFHCVMSKESVKLIRNYADRHGVKTGQALENLVSNKCENDPEMAGVLSIMDIECIMNNQTEENKIRTALIIAGSLIGKIVRTDKYTLEEALNEAGKNLNEVRRIVDDFKRQSEEEEIDED